MAYNERRRTKVVKNRNWIYVTFLDLRKAFDSVDRVRLVQLLRKTTMKSDLVTIIKNCLQNTVINYQQNRIETNVGVPQGAVLSPTLFNVYIDSLVALLHSCTASCFAFADDLVFISRGKQQLTNALEQVNKWSEKFDIKLNKEKSGILVIRADRRTRFQPHEFFGIKTVEQYRYLGVVVDDCASLKPLGMTLNAK